ncbi:NUDIX domain-containing protein [Arthrobacter sp. S39]|nr:NUDIX domain-containing protein [Arthrobacter sp. S39]
MGDVMNFDPQKFFIGLMDFFSILLPGALLTYLVIDEVGLVVLGDRYDRLASAEAWAAFLVASYLVGHLVFLLGSWLDGIYDLLRSRTLNRQVSDVANRGRLLGWPARVCVALVFKRERNLAVDRVVKIKEQALGGLQAKDAINSFQWCKALLNVESRESLAVVQRFEADSKFFRCFTVVLLVLLAAWPFHQKWTPAGIPVVLGLLLLALWRYMEQRYKATNQAYWSVITLEARKGKITIDKAVPAAGAPLLAGGVVSRMRRGEVEYLLVEATGDPSQWVLPKGHVEEGEQHRETAVREVLEETGVWAGIVDFLDDAEYVVDGSAVTTRYFLMRALGRGLRKDKERRAEWLSPQQAAARATFPETRRLLEAADLRRAANDAV